MFHEVEDEQDQYMLHGMPSLRWAMEGRKLASSTSHTSLPSSLSLSRGRHLSTKSALSWDLQIQVLLQKRETAKNKDYRKLLQRKELNDWKKKKRKKKSKTKTIEKRKKNQEKESDQKRKQKEKKHKTKKVRVLLANKLFNFAKKKKFSKKIFKILNV